VSASPLASIDLGYVSEHACDARGNCEIERASVELVEGGRSRSGRVVDVHLMFQ
jgi:hypothetical protein